MISMLLSALILVGDTPAVTPAPPAEVPVATTEAKPKKERKICRALGEVIGSRTRQRECRTEAQWASEDARQSVGDARAAGSN